MLKFFTLISLIALSCKNNTTTTTSGSPITETEVKNFIDAYDKAWDAKDTMAMKEMMDEKYIYFTSTGITRTRENILGWFTPDDKYKIDTALRNEVSVIVNDNIAIASTHWVGSGTFGTETFNDDQRCGLVIQKSNGKLKIVSEHCVQIVK